MSHLVSDTNYQAYTLQHISATQRQQWDDFVAAHRQGHLLQSWEWGELKTSASWHPLRLALCGEQGQIVAAAQILRRTAPHVPTRFGHLAYIPKGPMIDWSHSALCSAFFSQLHRYLRRQGALALRIEPNIIENKSEEVASFANLMEELHFHATRAIQPLRTIMLDITPDEATLLVRMKEKWRYNVRLAQRKGVTVREAQSEDDVRAWYVLMQTTSERDQFGIHTLDYYLKIWRIFAPRNQLRLLLAEHNGQLLAGIFVGLFARQGIYLYGASSNEQRNLMPNYLLQWEAIRWARAEGATCYDFWGIPETDDDEEAMAGVYRFKRGWGGEIVRFVGCYEQVYVPFAMRFIK